MNQRLVKDAAWELACQCTDVVEPCLRPDEVRDAFLELLELCRKGIEDYHRRAELLRSRLHPCSEGEPDGPH
jgi:hypothetical protein